MKKIGLVGGLSWTSTLDYYYDLILNACKSLKSNNVDFIALCANTAHLFADEIQSTLGIPIIHIASATAEEIQRQKLLKVGLLGTKFTMEMDFYRNKLKEYNIEAIVPSEKKDIEEIQDIVKNELGKGIINQASKQKFIRYTNELRERGVEGLILGCTEIPLLIGQIDFEFPVFDTTRIHVESIVNFALDK